MLRAVKVTLFSLLVVSLVTTSFGAGYVLATAGDAPSPLVGVQRELLQSGEVGDAPKHFRLLSEIWDILGQDFVDPKAVDPDALGRGAINGLITALGDNHTSYIDADSYRAEQSGIRGAYEGIGAHVMLVDGVLTIVAPLPGSPAEKSGIRAGDKILAVNGKSTEGMNLLDAVNLVKGPKGTKVALLILHENEELPQTIEVTREQIKTRSVLLRMLPEGIAHVRIAQFSQRTSVELREALEEAEKESAKGVILDLRNNPGGLLDVTVEATSQFLEGGIAGYQVDREGNREALRIRNSGEVISLPMVVLINRGSASGSELLAGALQDRDRAILIGTKSFGKGSVNHLRELSDGSGLYVTIGRWLTPNGTQIEGNGLVPDIEVEFSEDDIRDRRDAQMERALQVLLAQIG